MVGTLVLTCNGIMGNMQIIMGNMQIKHTVNNNILLIAQHEPTFELDTSHRLANLILSKTLMCKFNYPSFSDEKTGP